MSQAVFQELVERMVAEGIDELPSKARATFCALAKEEPLYGIEEYGKFIQCGLLHGSVSTALTNTRGGVEGLQWWDIEELQFRDLLIHKPARHSGAGEAGSS